MNLVQLRDGGQPVIRQRPDSANPTTTRDTRRRKGAHVVAWFDSNERPPKGYRRHFDCKPKVGGGVAFFTIYEPINEVQTPTDCTEVGGSAGTTDTQIADHQDDDGGGDSDSEPEPPPISGQCAEVLELLRTEGSVLSFRMTAELAIHEAAARIHNLRGLGFNIITKILPEVEFRGRIRRNVALYSLGVPCWPAPGFLKGGAQ